MALFKNPKNGEIYDVKFNTCNASGFCADIDCKDCPMYNRQDYADQLCSEWAMLHPEEAAKLMGYEYLGDGNDTAQSTSVTRKSILEAAEKCVCGDRDQQYGSPERSFDAIADFWGAYLWNKHNLGKSEGVGVNFISADDVAAMMVLFKIARVATGQNKADNWIDAAGYAACGGEIGGNK